MDKMFLCFLLPFLMCEAERQNRQCCISNQPDTCSDKNDTKEKVTPECDNLPAESKEEDEFDLFPLGYLSDMYFVQADVDAENCEPVKAFHKRNMAHIVVENHEQEFLNVEQDILHLLTTRGVDRECMKTAIKDYCDHLCELIDNHVADTKK
jgi:hypothetical protein